VKSLENACHTWAP